MKVSYYYWLLTWRVARFFTRAWRDPVEPVRYEGYCVHGYPGQGCE
jgi:hypothetical protein